MFWVLVGLVIVFSFAAGVLVGQIFAMHDDETPQEDARRDERKKRLRDHE